jgi:hypothetical protein
MKTVVRALGEGVQELQEFRSYRMAERLATMKGKKLRS